MSDKLLRNFISKLNESKKDNSSYWNINSYELETCITSLISFDKYEIKKIISNDYWIRYPTWSTQAYKNLGPGIQKIVAELSISYPKLFSYIGKHGKGIWMCYALDYANGREKIAISKRASKSRDNRARLRAAKSLPVSYLKKMLNDPTDSVKNIVLKRIGIENCYSDLLDDSSEWIRTMAVTHSELDSFDYEPRLLDYLNNIKNAKLNNKWESWRDQHAAQSILSKMEKEDLLYYLDLVSYSDKLSRVIRARLSSNWG